MTFFTSIMSLAPSSDAPLKLAGAAQEVAGENFHTNLSPTLFVDLVLLSMLVLVAWQAMKSRHLFAVVMLSGIYSLLSAAFFVSLDAVDVAFTEAAVGAGISTVLMLGGMLLTTRCEKPMRSGRQPVALATVVAVGAALVYATIDMPAFEDPNAPANRATAVGQRYVQETPNDIEVPNIVTAVLASYRGFDTLGETLVIFTAGLAVILLLGAGSARGGRAVYDDSPDDDSPGKASASKLSHTSNTGER